MRNLFRIAVLALAVIFGSPQVSPAQEPSAGAKVYKQAVGSVVWIHSNRGDVLVTGSGALIDRERKLVLTNYHVVGENPRVEVYFPKFRDDQPIPEKTYYKDHPQLKIKGKVLVSDQKVDLAIIRLESIPEGAKAISLATDSPGPGDSVHSIGSAGKSGALWGYVKGTVRQVYRKKWKAALDKHTTLTFEAKVIETDSPTNPGDSGGPLLNDKGELVGVTQGGVVDAQLVSFFIELSEVKKIVESRMVKSEKNSDDEKKKEPEKKESKRTTPLAIKDGAKLFSPESVKDAEKDLDELFKKNLDVLVETYAAAPDDILEKARAAKGEERFKLLRKWGEERLRAEKAKGVMILVCADPRAAVVIIDPEVNDKFPDKYAQKITNALIEKLSKKKPDAGLAEAITLIKDGLKGDKK